MRQPKYGLIALEVMKIRQKQETILAIVFFTVFILKLIGIN